jgi:hypothetical protein
MANFFTRPKFEDRQLVQYSGTSITLSGETNIYPTGLLRIQKNPVPGYVATAAGWDGEVVWGPVSGLTWNLSASCNSIINVAQLVACTDSGSTIQITSGGLTLDGGTIQFLDPLSAGTVNDYALVLDGSGYIKQIPTSAITSTPSPYIFGSPTISIIPLSGNNTTLSDGSIILGGTGNTINDSSSPLSTIVNGYFNDIYDSDFSLINGGLFNVISGQSYGVITNGRQNTIISRSTLTNLSGWKTIINGRQNTINIVSGETGYETILNGRLNNILGTSTLNSTIINGDSNVISGSSSANKYNTVLNGLSNSINEGNFNFVNGQENRLNEKGFFNFVNGQENRLNESSYSVAFGKSNNINNSDYSFIFGFNSKILEASNGNENSRVILGSNSLISGQTSSVVILGDNITGNSSNTVYVPNLNIGTIGSGTSIFNLGIDANGNVVSGSTGTGGGGSGTFTGNTSTSCITDLWVSNIYGCNNNLNITGDTYIAGTLYATSKSFAIPHPTEKDKQLIYGSLEGPENGVYHRGKLVGNNTINLPDYWSSLVDIETVTVTLTPNGSYQKLYVVSILDNSIVVGSEDNITINCFYTVYGERKDIKKLETEI